MKIIDSDEEAILKIPVWHEYSPIIGYLSRPIEKKHKNAVINFSDFLSSNVAFKIENENIDQKGVTTFTGTQEDLLGKITELKFYTNAGINLYIFDLSPEDFLKEINKLEKQGWHWEEDHHFSVYNKKYKHDQSRTRFQRFFGLNKYVEA